MAFRGEGAYRNAFAELAWQREIARGYRWSDGSEDRPKSWWTEIDEELRYLRSEIYLWNEGDPPVKRLTVFDRFKA
ncbi:hypothetical protein ATB98_12250 [Sinorhizobium saheli]|uniref:Uncharacterized protein n=1 Tax=Sinorhizobium saheli TaxID=36856 RepID=A0A178YR38_SINSA|nr:hypothetical protein ATB98_12250 [Sinorhizobium saheli]